MVSSDPIGYGVIEVTRNYEGVRFISSNLSQEEENDVLLTITSQQLGDSQTKFFIVDQCGYLVSLTGDATQLRLNIAFSSLSTLSLPLVCHPILYQKFDNFFHEPTPFSRSLTTAPITETLESMRSIKHLDPLLFSLFTLKPLFVLGSHHDVLKWFLHFIRLLPREVGKTLPFSTYSSTIDSHALWQGLPPLKAMLEQLSSLSYPITVFSIPRLTVQGNFTSPTTQELASLLYEGQFTNFLKMLSSLFTTVLELDPSFSVVDIVDHLSVEFPEAELIHAMKQVLASHSQLTWCVDLNNSM